MAEPTKVHPLRLADASRGVRHVFVRDLVLEARIGVHRHEHQGPQSVRINVDLTVAEGDGALDDKLENVVDYGLIVRGIKAIVAAGHINLVETLAERIAALGLADHRVEAARVRVEKLHVVAEAESVGVEIERFRPRG